MSNTSPEMNSFVVMIHKLNGRELTDMTDQGVKDIIAELGSKRLAIGVIKDFLVSVKKKLDFELETFFPGLIDSPNTKEFYIRLKKRTLLVLETVFGSSDELSDQIKAIDKFLISSFKPRNYQGTNGIEVQMMKGFEETCVMLAQQGVSANPRNMTTLSFYQALETIKQQIKAKNKR